VPMLADSQPTIGRVGSSTAVMRAIAELRRGGLIVLESGDAVSLIGAAEIVTDPKVLAVLTGRPVGLVMGGARLASLLPPLAGEEEGAVVDIEGCSARDVERFLDPGFQGPLDSDLSRQAATTAQITGLELMKLARLLPAALVSPLDEPAAAFAQRHDLLTVASRDIDELRELTRAGLTEVARASVPLLESVDTTIVAFRPADGGKEHLAIVLGSPDLEEPALVRLHSECFTGDLLSSLRCDCGDQLQGALREIAASGGGIILYLAQEGRGIGLVNKLRAYQLQDHGFDTIEANHLLGFDADERVYRPAADMLRQLGVSTVRLMTNNPAKVRALEDCGIRVRQRVPHAFPANGHNERYLRTKALRAGHIL